MPLATPVIDDRTFDDIVEEIRTRIPRYTDEWTDLNDNDLGMAFTQVYAWLVEMLLYRLGRVPEINYTKFLQLVGFELRPAQPATAEITFPVNPNSPDAWVIVPLHTQVQAEEKDDEGAIVFETDRAINAVRAQLASVLVEVGGARKSVSEMNESAEGSFGPFGPAAALNSALLLGFTEALPPVDLDLAFFSAGVSQAKPRQCGPSAPIAAHARAPIPITWEYWNGRSWESMTLLDDQTAALMRGGHVRLRSPGAAMKRAEIKPEPESMHWIRARLTREVYDVPPLLKAVRTNTVSATQAETIRREILGGSDASPDQTFRLRSTPVLAGSLKLTIDEGREQRAWREVTDLFQCKADETCFALNRSSGVVRFGDGRRFGEIPLANPANRRTNIVAEEYRVGGGTRGNVPAGSLTALTSPVPGVDSRGVTNLEAAQGGADEETLREIESRARVALRHNDRAVAMEDFETLAEEVGGVARAKALPLFHPHYPEIEVPGVVTVIVIPKRPKKTAAGEVALPRNPTPGEITLQSVCSALDNRRLLTTEVYVIGPKYRKVEVSGRVVAEDGVDLASVVDAVRETMLAFLDPLMGGMEGDGWPFGGTIFYSQVIQRIVSIKGVRRVAELVVAVDGREQPACADVPICRNEVVFSEPHDRIVVEYEDETTHHP